MEQMHCGLMGDPSLKLCLPLQQLKDEHIPLRKQMDDLKILADTIGENPDTDDWSETILFLAEKVNQFTSELEPHSDREEGILFPMMYKYIGRESGPIAVMEYEHDTAKNYLNTFKDQVSIISGAVEKNKATELAKLVIEAYYVLTDHFMKEENVLFPMAEKFFSDAEKEELARKLQSSWEKK